MMHSTSNLIKGIKVIALSRISQYNNNSFIHSEFRVLVKFSETI